MAWDFFHGSAESSAERDIPLLFRYVEDRDIWRWALHQSKEVNAGASMAIPTPRPGKLVSPHKDFEKIRKVFEDGEAGVKRLAELGSVITRYEDSLVRRAVRSASKRRLKLAPEEVAYVVNSTVLASDIGNALAMRALKEDSEVSYALIASYQPRSKGWGISLRSLYGNPAAPNAADVSKIANKYGGGGHRAAAGMRANICDLESLFVEEEEK
uniref:DHHA1 domain-containing protein n=1 Tax=Rhizochromulina marina TaxID=1034831 RepID=A0A7S2WUL1_9STRA